MGRHPGYRLAAWSSPHRGKRLWCRSGANTAGTRYLLSGLGFGLTFWQKRRWLDFGEQMVVVVVVAEREETERL